MSNDIVTLTALLPDYAKDLRLNLSSLAADAALTQQQKAGAFVACAMATREPRIIAAVLRDIEAVLTPQALTAAKIAAAIMGMTNVYYRFSHLVSAPDYKTLPARLRMNALANPGVEKEDFELWALAVSAVNGCGACLDAHEKVLRQHGMGPDKIQVAVRIAAVINAVAAVAAIEQTRTLAVAA